MAPDFRVKQPVGELRFDAGSLALNLVATVGRRFGEPLERLDSLQRLREWLSCVGFDHAARPSEADLTAIRDLREHLDLLFRHALHSEPPPRGTLRRVNATAALTSPTLRTSRAGLALAPSVTGALDAILALIAQDAIRIVAGSERHNLRACDADDCQMLFLSHGRRERRWCSSARCGNRKRVAAHRARATR